MLGTIITLDHAIPPLRVMITPCPIHIPVQVPTPPKHPNSRSWPIGLPYSLVRARRKKHPVIFPHLICDQRATNPSLVSFLFVIPSERVLIFFALRVSHHALIPPIILSLILAGTESSHSSQNRHHDLHLRVGGNVPVNQKLTQPPIRTELTMSSTGFVT